ncbi:nuclear transport factor 2 family protein [Blastococcus sp. KM273128]|uniref:nuclear transport factor 2 family protein n=1 Tax=Blastococcus sp. KM273128 TaxID=2570314 RepID=UPI001F396EF8|nr:nuclear transport factor 2 family protein [Blastococcus sp. KM273128]MCF6744668.1 nuclear transport factor 2 family protein [Blastococcus sp. KM273128]
MSQHPRSRTIREVMTSHLHHRRTGDLEADLAENYHPEVVVLSAREVFRGHDGVRSSAHRLWRAAAEGTYSYGYVLADDRMAMLEWSGRNEQFDIRCGVDSYLVEDGWITAQTIHYRVEDAGLSVAGALIVPADQVGVHAVDDPARLPGLADGT